ncbi:MAG: hypothetical protein R3B68_06070 [Phycisphaerales bacterium]
MHSIGTAILGAFELLRLAVVSRFRLRGPYWSWRWHTAFGRGSPPRPELLWAMLRFGRWARRMRRF